MNTLINVHIPSLKLTKISGSTLNTAQGVDWLHSRVFSKEIKEFKISVLEITCTAKSIIKCRHFPFVISG